MKRLCVAAFLAALLSASVAHAGGPRYVAGTSYFNPAMTGKPIVWANGQLKYYTDLDSLSASVTQSQANAMVASAAAVWNAVPTAAVNIVSGGSLSEDVNGTNVISNDSSITIPADIQSGNTSRPIAFVYDADGSVINAFFGPGASSAATCQQDGVFTFVDNLSSSGNIAHALVLVNGLCATNPTQISILQYQLVRALGQVLGLDWSQTNEEMFAGDQVTADGLQGWPIMHPIERLCNKSGVSCMPNATTLRPDDIAALNRLYPVSAANIASFKNKKLTAPNTLSVAGTISFRNGQGMQGVNVVLRPMLPGNDQPDMRYTVTAVSGVLFHGNAGNLINGLNDANGNALARFGSADATLEGHFDLSGVPVPAAYARDTWQLSFEPINPLYTTTDSVGPYTTGQVAPSGTRPTFALPGLAAGSSVIQDVTIGDSAADSLSGDDGFIAAPVTVSPTGEWTARLSGYGHASFLQWWAKANREFTVEAYALDDSGNNTLTKAQVVLGMWNGTDPITASPVVETPQPFNGAVAGLTTLPVLTLDDSEVRLGVADMRGDGRPDYLYRGRVLYADSVHPAILPAAGGPIVINGMGFHANSVVTINGANAAVTSVTPTQITAVAPPSAGATGDVLVEVQDPQTLGIAAISDGLSYGAQNNDTISILAAPSGSVTPGAPLAFTVAVNNDGAPAPGATVTFAVTQGSATLACGQPSCSVVTAANGTATLAVAANSAVSTSVTAVLANGASVATQFSAATGAPSAISALTPIAGVTQNISFEQPFSPVIFEATDPIGNPLAGAVVTIYETLNAWMPACSAQAICPPAPLIEQRSLQLSSGSDGMVVLNPISSPGQPVRLYITAVTGSSALLNFALEQFP